MNFRKFRRVRDWLNKNFTTIRTEKEVSYWVYYNSREHSSAMIFTIREAAEAYAKRLKIKHPYSPVHIDRNVHSETVFTYPIDTE